MKKTIAWLLVCLMLCLTVAPMLPSVAAAEYTPLLTGVSSSSDADDYLTGDVDNDGKISAADARLALRAAVGLEYFKKDSIEFSAADIDNDGIIRAKDARLILRGSVGLEKLVRHNTTTPTDSVVSPSDGYASYTDGKYIDAPNIIAEYEIDNGYLRLNLFLENSVGTKAYDFNINYDADVLKFGSFKRIDYYSDENPTITHTQVDANGTNSGTINVAGFFMEELYSSDYYSSIDEDISGEHFLFATVNFKINKSDVTSTRIYLNIYNDSVYTIGKITSCRCILDEDAEPVIKLVEKSCDEGILKVAVIAENCVGLTSGDFELEYDADYLSYKEDERPIDAKLLNSAYLISGNYFASLTNGNIAGTVKGAFCFDVSLDANYFIEESGSVLDIDENYFELFILVFDIKDSDLSNTSLKLTGATHGVEADCECILKLGSEHKPPENAEPVIKLVEKSCDEGMLKVAVVAENCKGLTSVNLVVKYDANVLNAIKCLISGDAKAVKDTANPCTLEKNLGVAGNIAVWFYFKESLDANYFIEESGSVLDIDENYFELFILVFDIKDSVLGNTSLELSGTTKGVVADCECCLKFGHEHNYTSVTVAPTCTDDGYTEYTCNCGNSYKDNYVSALGHSWNSGVITTPATATVTGVKTFTCTRANCGATKTETIAKLKVTKVEAKEATTSTAGNIEYYICNGKYYYDAKCTREVKPADITIPVIACSYGDIDDDGKITAADARLALRASVGLEKYSADSVVYKACDVDGDGKITAADARLILRASVGLEDSKKWGK